MIKHLIEKGNDVNAKNNKGWTSLHLAASKGNVDYIKILIKKGTNINAKNKMEYTPLHVAIMFGKKRRCDASYRTKR